MRGLKCPLDRAEEKATGEEACMQQMQSVLILLTAIQSQRMLEQLQHAADKRLRVCFCWA